MRMRSATHLVVALAIVFGASWLAYAELGGEGGVFLPYQGTLYDGGAPVSSEVTLRFEVLNAASGGDVCLNQAKTFTPVNGAFAVKLGPVDDACIRGADLYLQVRDPDGVEIGARQRIFPAVAAATSGGGDFHVGGALTTTSLTTTELTASGKATLTSGLTLSGGAGNKSLDVNGHTETDSLTVLDDADLGDVSAESITAGSVAVSGTLALDSLAVTGQVSWDCPAGTYRVGDRCVTYNRGRTVDQTGTVSYTAAAKDCHDQGMTLCPLETVFMCDVLDSENTTDYSCGFITDLPALPITYDASIVTSTPFGESESGHSVTCFSSVYWAGAVPVANYRRSCTGGQFYFCCSPVNPTTF